MAEFGHQLVLLADPGNGQGVPGAVGQDHPLLDVVEGPRDQHVFSEGDAEPVGHQSRQLGLVDGRLVGIHEGERRP